MRLMKLLVLSTFFVVIAQASTYAKSYNIPFNVTAKTGAGLYHELLDQADFEVKSIEVKEIKSTLLSDGPADPLGQVIMTVDRLIAFGKKLWTIVEAGKPISKTDFVPLHVLPKIEGDYIPFYEMENWSAPQTRSYKVTYKNAFGVKIIEFNFTLTFQHGGSYQGKGKYITGFNIVPSKLSVTWGFQFDASTKVLAIANLGTTDSPLASATLNLNFNAESPLKKIDSTMTFYVDGTGTVKVL